MHSTDPTTINRCSYGNHMLGCRCERIAPPDTPIVFLGEKHET